MYDRSRHYFSRSDSGRFTDLDVVKDQERDGALTKAAVSYVKNYTGSFLFLRNAQIALRTRALRIQEIRGVLNVMLADPNVSDLQNLRCTQQSTSTQMSSRVQSSPPTPQPMWIELKTHWPRKFITSTHNATRYIHILNTERCSIKFLANAEHRAWDSRFYSYVHVHCGTRINPDAWYKNNMLLTLSEAIDMHANKTRAWCRKCTNLFNLKVD